MPNSQLATFGENKVQIFEEIYNLHVLFRFIYNILHIKQAQTYVIYKLLMFRIRQFDQG